MKKLGFFAIFIVLLGAVWAQIETPDLKVPNLPDAPKKIISVPIDTFLSVPKLPSVERRFINIPTDTFLQVPRLPEIGSRDFEAPQIASLSIPDLPTIETQRFKIPEDIPLGLPNLPGTVWEDVRKISDLSGGLDLVSAKTKVDSTFAIELKNAIWNPEGELEKREGYSEHSTPPFIPNFLYRYYQQDGDKWTMGGSDTALYFWHPDTSGDGWTYLTGTEGTSGRWDGTTFQDMFVGTHEGIVPVVWNGSTLVTLGTSVDSFKVLSWFGSCAGGSGCRACSTKFSFDPAQTGWDNNEWYGYTLGFWVKQKDYAGTWDTVFVYDYILSNTDHEIDIRNYSVGKTPINGYYARIYAWFQIDSIWREGTIDRSDSCDNSQFDYAARLIDSAYADWDSTFAYNDYVFEVVGGTGEGIITYLNNYSDQIGCGEGWNDSGFIVPTHSYDCFDTTTTYRIYAVKFWEGSKFCANAFGALWLGWTGIGEEQEKNVIVYSATDDLGNWPSSNYIILESDDGDYITGMEKFPGEYTDVPRQELVVFKNNSFYKITPSGDAYDFWLIANGVGCVSNLAISPAEGLLLFPDQHGVWAYDKRKPISISKKIKPIFEEWDIENLEDVSAVYNPQDRHYYLSYPGFYGVDYLGGGFISVFVMDSAQVKDGYWTHNLDSAGNETGDDVWKFYESAGSYVDIAAKSDEEYAIMFKKSSGAPGYKVFLAFFDEDGVQIGDTLRIDDAVDLDSGYAKDADHKLDMNSSGQIIACWTDQSDGNNDIRCQCVDFDTGLVGGNFFVNEDSSTNSGDYVSWGVGINEDGIGVVTWMDLRDNATYLAEVYAQRVQCSDASKLGVNFKINDEDDAYNDGIAAVAVGDNTFVVAWVSFGGGTADCVGGSCLYKKAFNIDGTARESDVLLSDCAGGNTQESSISMNSRGNYVIAYDKECTGTYKIYMMAFNSADAVQLSETLVQDNDTAAQGPDVSINNRNVMTVVWYDGRDASVQIAYRSYGWSGALMASDSILSSSAYCGYPEIDCFLSPPDTGTYTLAWSFDFGGWSRETFIATAYAYQHSLLDPAKIIFAGPDGGVYNYATQADDVNDPVILTYQSPFFEFTEHPSFVTELEYFTLEASLDTGNIYLTSYRDYSETISEDTIQCGGDCRHELTLPDELGGKNISVKIITGTEIDTFSLSGYTIETITEKSRK